MDDKGDGKQSAPIDWNHLQREFVGQVEDDALLKFARDLRLPGGDEVAVGVLRGLGIGFHKAKKSWTFPERDELGQVVGISCRPERGGKKFMVTGSSHGMIYALDPDGNAKVPSSLEWPILVVEGATDVATALCLGFWAWGKPSATGTTESNAYLQKMAKGQDIALVGENDGGVGLVSILDQAKRLVPKAKSVRTLWVPKGIKDIREWGQVPDIEELLHGELRKDPWTEDLVQYVAGDVLLDTAPMRIAESFIAEKQKHSGETTLRHWNDQWFEFNGKSYTRLDLVDVRSRMYVYLDGKKVIKTEGKGENKEWIEENYNPDKAKVSRVLDALPSVGGVLVSRDQEMPGWLGPAGTDPSDMAVFRNGILDVASFCRNRVHFLRPTPKWFSQAYCDYDFDPKHLDDGKPFYDDFLLDVLGGDREAIELLQQWIGYNMVADNRHEKFLMMIGRPGAGKGTVFAVMEKVIGKSNVVQTTLTAIADRFGLEGLLGKTACFMPDAHSTNFDKMTSALEVIKTVTGRGGIMVDQKNMKAMDVHLATRFTIGVNELPRFNDTASALRRRLLVLPFPNTYEGRADPGLKERLQEERVIRGVAVWALQGYCKLRATGQFTTPGGSKIISREFERQNNPVVSFVEECCIVGDDRDQISKTILYEAWRKWARRRHLQPGKFLVFCQRVTATLPDLKTTKAPRDPHTGTREPMYKGLRLRNGMDLDDDE